MRILLRQFAFLWKKSSLLFSQKKSLEKPAFLLRDKALYQGNFNKYIKYLYALAWSLQQSFKSHAGDLNGEDNPFKQYLIQVASQPSNYLPLQRLEELEVKLWNMKGLLMAWEDP